MLRITYFVSRVVRVPHRRGRPETRNGVLRVKGSWASDATHSKIRRRIMERNTGWQVGGYTLNPTITPVVDAAGNPVGVY
jgi:hypothetical protein